MRIFFVDDFSLALYNKLYGMKAYISLAILFIIGFNNDLKAQWNDYSFYYNSIDSINTTSIMRADEDSANYYLHLSNFHLVDLVGRNIYNCNVMFPNKSSVIIPHINEGIYLVKFSNGNQSFSSKVIHVK